MEDLRPPGEWFILDPALCRPLLVPTVQALLGAEAVPHFPVKEKSVGEVYGGHGVLFDRVRVASEFYFEVLWLLREATEQMKEAQAAGGAHDWHCRKCGEENPGNFDVCWSCETQRAPD